MAIKRMTKADHPQSFTVFKPVGHVVVAMPDDESATAPSRICVPPVSALRTSWSKRRREEQRDGAAMLQQASGVAGFGYEVSLMRKYQALARDGASWLIVYAPEEDKHKKVAEIVRAHGALMAEMYHRLVIEDLV